MSCCEARIQYENLILPLLAQLPSVFKSAIACSDLPVIAVNQRLRDLESFKLYILVI